MGAQAEKQPLGRLGELRHPEDLLHRLLGVADLNRTAGIEGDVDEAADLARAVGVRGVDGEYDALVPQLRAEESQEDEDNL